LICFITSGSHKYAVRELRDVPGMPKIELMSYNQLLRKQLLPRATYIFTDFDRVDFWTRELAAKVYRCLKAGGATVLNDPANVRTRLAMLKRLKVDGLNSFSVWDAETDGLPDCYPVFLRTRAAHRGTQTDLLETPEAAQSALEALTASGLCKSDLMFVEYCAEPIEDGLFRKLAAYCVGDRVITGMSVHDESWHAKYGKEGAATEALYVDEMEAVRDNRHADAIAGHFKAAGISFGRADFTLVNGKVEVYEINTNPNNSRILDHPFPLRVDTDALFHQRLAEAMQGVDTTPGGDPIRLDHPDLVSQRKRDGFLTRPRWTP
jgi:hypothetical protein